MTSHESFESVNIRAPRSHKPHLLTFNRKLRHLHGITIRNLTISPVKSRFRRKTIDDDALPYTLSSPKKLLAINEARKATKSQSSSNLRADSVEDTFQNKNHDGLGGRAVSAHQSARHHRKSSSDWLGADPKQRQKHVEDAISRHKCDAFFSLHCRDIDGPIYISEIAERSMNPGFRFFNLEKSGPTSSRSDEASIKVFARRDFSQDWVYLVDEALSLKSLRYLGRSVDDLQYPLPENCTIFHLSDGVYAQFPVSQAEFDHDGPGQTPTALSHLQSTPTSSYDSLMRLSTLEACKEDALATQNMVTDKINTLDASKSLQYFATDAIPAAREHLASIYDAIGTTRKQVKTLQEQLYHLLHTLKIRRDRMQKGRQAYSRAPNDLESSRTLVQQSRLIHPQILDSIAGQRRRICADLSTIYPIEPLPGRKPTSLSFSIRDLHLPNSIFTSPNLREDHISAALGYVSHLVYTLSCYLCIPLPYPVTPRASSSTICDPISKLSASAVTLQFSSSNNPVFPLHLSNGTRGARRVVSAVGSASFYRFEYAVFLLNKDIELLASRLGLPVLDIRQTLPNLKYILFVATAGKGEAPARKAGGIRGLIRGGVGLGGSRESSRRGSEESTDRTPGLKAGEGVDGAPGAGGGKGKGRAVDGKRANGQLPRRTEPGRAR